MADLVMASRVVRVTDSGACGEFWATLDNGLSLQLTYSDLARNYHAPMLSAMDFASRALGLQRDSKELARWR